MKLIIAFISCVFARRSWEHNEETLGHSSLIKFEEGPTFAIRDLLLANEISGSPDVWPEAFSFPMAFKFWIYLTIETLTYDSSLEAGKDITQIDTFHQGTHIVFDPYNNRAKQLIVDETYKTPTKVGYIYEFNNNRMLMYEKYKNICVEEPLENSSEFFKEFE